MKRSLGTIALVMLCGMVCVAQEEIGIFDGQASVGDDALAGEASFDSDTGVYEIWGSGNDIWDPPDGFYWVYVEITGDFTATATVEWDTDPFAGDEWKKAGIIARDTLDPFDEGCQYACAAIILGNFNNFFTRTSEEDSEDDIVDGRDEDLTPYTFELQLKREGTTFYMSRGLVDGGFAEISSFSFPEFSDTVLVGLCVTSHDTSTLEIAHFSNVSIDQTTAVGDFCLY